MITITLDDIIYEIPDSWDDMTIEQQEICVTKILPLVDKAFMDVDGKKEPVSNDVINQIHIITLQLLLFKKTDFFKIPPDHVHLLIHDHKVTEFVFKKNGPLNLRKRKWKRLVGPDEFIKGITIEELLVMNKFYAGYKKTGNEDLLLPFLACIYRPTYNGVKIPFKLDDVHLREKTVKSMPLAQKLLTIRWFEATLEKLDKLTPDVPKSTKESSNPVELILQVSKDGPFGDFNKTRMISPDIFYIELNRIAKEIAEFENKNPVK